MKHVDEFRSKRLATAIIENIRKISKKQVNFMEICGTHTHSISKYGIREALPKNIRLISGPGCPVCVTSGADIDMLITFASQNPDVTVAAFGDMMRVPGANGRSLQDARSDGADVRVLYSPINVIEIAKADPTRQTVLFAVGFETTAPTVAATMLIAKEAGVKNLSVVSLHKLTPPAMKALLDAGELKIDGFICPGHVTAITGANAYAFIAKDYHAPCVVAGFEPVDALMGIYMLIKQLEEGRSDIEIEYDRVVTPKGNLKAREVMYEVMEPIDASWRGIGVIPVSGLGIKDEYSFFDAQKRFSMERGVDAEPPGCACGSVLKGLMEPDKCPLFARACTPDSPIGPCMVSFEGTCAAYYKYSKAVSD